MRSTLQTWEDSSIDLVLKIIPACFLSAGCVLPLLPQRSGEICVLPILVGCGGWQRICVLPRLGAVACGERAPGALPDQPASSPIQNGDLRKSRIEAFTSRRRGRGRLPVLCRLARDELLCYCRRSQADRPAFVQRYLRSAARRFSPGRGVTYLGTNMEQAQLEHLPERRPDRGEESSFFLRATAIGLVSVAFNFAMAAYRSEGDVATISFVTYSYLFLFLLFFFQRLFKNMSPESPLHEHIIETFHKVPVMLMVVFSYKVKAIMAFPVHFFVLSVMLIFYPTLIIMDH
ncbi:hypothetical protein GUJ93_ZPchr0006g41570 [Zizania palustris]|uniref:Uncharacterized protein n=1 Tax=Zizania palustris TaxID=103762 RepID=A0A8J5TB03_ZIZPA|nr:hypothetical protein GUJ93_ZPchr0006g41570 [Zizania palustris]